MVVKALEVERHLEVTVRNQRPQPRSTTATSPAWIIKLITSRANAIAGEMESDRVGDFQVGLWHFCQWIYLDRDVCLTQPSPQMTLIIMAALQVQRKVGSVRDEETIGMNVKEH